VLAVQGQQATQQTTDQILQYIMYPPLAEVLGHLIQPMLEVMVALEVLEDLELTVLVFLVKVLRVELDTTQAAA
jgi:hypothetical protein